MTSPVEYHVFAQGVGGWLVREDADGRVVSRHLTRGQAVAHAQRLAAEYAGRLVVHGLDGRVLRATTHQDSAAVVG